MDSRGHRLSHNDYTVACICPDGVELAAVEGMLDEIHESPSVQSRPEWIYAKPGWDAQHRRGGHAGDWD